MYFNDVFIGYYVIIAFLGFFVGTFVAWCNYALPLKKKVISKEFFSKFKEGLELNYFFMIMIAISYMVLLYIYGINFSDLFANANLIKFLILTPMLYLVFFIDIKHRIIPNRLNLTIFETGIAITFLYGISNLNMAKDYIFGMIVGGIIFMIITILGKFISGKEVMGYGDVKFMGAIGLYYGVYGILDVCLGAFFIGAVISVFVLIYRFLIIKSKDEYIPFGPFLSVTAFICMYIPTGLIVNVFMAFCTLLSNYI